VSLVLQFFLRQIHRLQTRLRGAGLALTGVRLGPGVCVGPGGELALGVTLARRGAIVLGDRTRLDRGVLLHPYGGRIETGIDVYLGAYSVIYGHGGVLIGKDTLISMHCRILSSDHALPPPGTIIRSQPDVLKPTRIGADVWLGAGVTVLGGVTIGDGCVVGVPATVRGHRA
jgi:carbonic anhydrase/acetyltransferase-like protein (isoleucine patch superfamily)